MRSQSNKTRERRWRLIASFTAVALILGCLALGGRTLSADGGNNGGGPMTPGGGDAIGSLPFTSGPPEGQIVVPKPSIVFEGQSLEAIQSLVVDAWGDGYAQLTELGETGGVRVELQGRVTVLLNRSRLHETQVTFGLDVSQGFSGGMAILSKEPHVLKTQLLPATGDLALPLGVLSASSLLDTGGLTLHSVSTTQKHHKLQIAGSGGTLRLVVNE